jgi:uncharacterized lipoprotein YbaY
MLAGFLSAAPTQAQTSQRCFVETGQCINGRIRQYWEQSGGLPVFGFPITSQREERIDGQLLQVQWFERARLELHPDNPRPYDVLIGRVGSDRLAQLGRDWRSFPIVDEATGGDAESCRFFRETSHTVCGAFLTAYRSYGLDFGMPGIAPAESLALFGLPLSQPITETLSDGRQYQVQWFERARFELHPELSPTAVLFGLLGAEIQAAAPMAPTPRGSVPMGITGAEWKLDSFGAVDNPRPAVADAPATLRFGEDGRLSGNTGCNGVGGQYTATADRIEFGALVGTLRACDEPTNQQEREILRALQGTVRYELTADILRIFYDQDRSVLAYSAASASVVTTVTGTVAYRERIALVSGAEVTVRLLDISRQDVGANMLAEQLIVTTGQQVPIPFMLEYDPAMIRATGNYAVRAEIRINGELAFTTTEAYLVITQGRPVNVDVVVRRV